MNRKKDLINKLMKQTEKFTQEDSDLLLNGSKTEDI